MTHQHGRQLKRFGSSWARTCAMTLCVWHLGGGTFRISGFSNGDMFLIRTGQQRRLLYVKCCGRLCGVTLGGMAVTFASYLVDGVSLSMPGNPMGEDEERGTVSDG